MGSHTYRDMAAYWPTDAAAEEPFTPVMREIPKVVPELPAPLTLELVSSEAFAAGSAFNLYRSAQAAAADQSP
jgi:hypothetical protein